MGRLIALIAVCSMVAAAESNTTQTPPPEKVEVRLYLVLKGDDGPISGSWFHVTPDNAPKLVRTPSPPLENSRTAPMFGPGLFRVCENKPTQLTVGSWEVAITLKDGKLLWGGRPNPHNKHIRFPGKAIVLTGQECVLQVSDCSQIQYMERQSGNLFKLRTIGDARQGLRIRLLAERKTKDSFMFEIHLEVTRVADSENDDSAYNLAWAMKPPAIMRQTVQTQPQIPLDSSSWTGITYPIGNDTGFLLFTRLLPEGGRQKSAPVAVGRRKGK